MRIIFINFQGDKGLPTETCHPLNMESPLGINPMILDTKGDAPSLQALAFAAILKKALLLGADQEELLNL